MRKPVITWTFDDGEKVSVPLVDVERRLLKQHVRMAASDSPELVSAADVYFDKAAQRNTDEIGRYLNRVLTNRKNARNPRKKRGRSPATELIYRGLDSIRSEYSGVTASQLVDILDADGHFTDDDKDVEVRLDSGNLVFRDLKNNMQATVAKKSLRAYLNRKT